jgi:hypothetical protein
MSRARASWLRSGPAAPSTRSIRSRPFGEEPSGPEADERLGHPDGFVDVSAVERIVQRCAKVVVLTLESLEPRPLLGATEVGRGLLGGGEHSLQVSAARAVFFAGLGEPLAGEGVNRLQHRKARLTVRLLILS